MRVTIFTMGTRGDVEPAVALGIGLSARGHTVTVASHECFQGDIERRGLGFRRLPGDPERLFDHPAWSQWQPSAWRPLTHARLLRTVLAPLGEQITQDHFASAMEDTDAVLFTLTTSGAYDLAQERGLPCVGLRYTPLSPTRCFAHPALFPTSRSGGWENLLSYPIAERLFDEQFREPLRPAARRHAGLGSIPYVGGRHARWPPFPIVHGFTEALVPRPKDWPSHLHVVGSWNVPVGVDTELPEAAAAFLAAGDPPVYVGFGSMRVKRPEQLSRMLVDVIRRVGDRLIVSPGWAGLGHGLQADDVFVADLPHASLFPQVKAVIHHGGAGTTASALAAGRPTFIVPFAYDQPFWGHRVAAAGAGPRPVYAHRLTAERIGSAIEVLSRRDVRAAAEGIGKHMQAEQAVERGASLVEQLLETERSSSGSSG